MPDRFRGEKATNLPTGAYHKGLVYDFKRGGVARRPNGKLAYFRTTAQAKRYAAAMNRADKKGLANA